MSKCPECDTELQAIRQSRSKRIAWWCWKCERYLSTGEAHKLNLRSR